MCSGCWLEHGTPRIDTPAVRAAAELVASVYEHCPVGGNLHIVLDDWNIEDGSLAFCDKEIKNAKYEADFERNTPEQLRAERACHDAFVKLTIDERASALALNDGFWT